MVAKFGYTVYTISIQCLSLGMVDKFGERVAKFGYMVAKFWDIRATFGDGG